jgi:hypothetical protein
MAELTVPSAGDSIAASWGSAVADRVNAYGCVLLRTADLSISDATDTAVTFPSGSVTEQLDTDGFHDTGSATSRITIPASVGAGWYDVFGCVAFASDVDGNRWLWIEKNGIAGAGTLIVQETVGACTGGVATRLTVSTSVLLAAGDYISMGVRHSANNAINITAESFAPRFGCIRHFKT